MPALALPADAEVSFEEEAAVSRYADLALAALRSAGLRVTRPRRSVVELLERAERPLTAAGIHEALLCKRIDVDLASVYRTLAVLEQHSLIHRLLTVEGVVRCEPGFEEAACHHHTVCRQCGKVQETSCDGALALRAKVQASTGFTADSHRIELTGLCLGCAASA